MDVETLKQSLKTAMQHQQAGRLPQAEAILREILAGDPTNAIALHHLGLIAHTTGNREVALDLLNRSIAAAPKQVRFRTNFSAVLEEMGRVDDAINQLAQAVHLAPTDFELFKKLMVFLEAAGKTETAGTCWRDAIKQAPDHIELHNLAGAALGRMGFLDDSVAISRHAIALNSSNAIAHCNLGLALAHLGEIQPAIDSFYRAVQYKPDYHLAHQNLLFYINFHPEYEPPAIFAEHRRWARAHADDYGKSIKPHENDRDPDRVLRIGYVSPDFRDHPLARLIEPVLANHDRNKFHITCYSDVGRPDALTARIEKLADQWRAIGGGTDEELAQLIRHDRIDILVDLSLHMAGNRLLTFARKPAPINVTWLAYPGTSGLKTIDYRVSDVTMDPPDEEELARCYSEKSIRLKSFWCYAPVDPALEVNALPALTNGHITFSSFNNLAKVNDAVLDVWGDILSAVPDSRLLLLHNGGTAGQARVSNHFVQRGINSGRLEFIPRQPHAEYMKLYQRADIALDPFPYPGHTTTLDALWMGVPVVTTTGHTAISFGGASILTNLNLLDLITENRVDYAKAAIALAGDIPRLTKLRGELRGRLQKSPVGDAPGFTKSLEAEYRQMWEKWVASRMADHGGT